jgi:hypothetical protein
MTAESSPRRPPGTRLRALVANLFDQATAERILLPAIADLQHEASESQGGSRTARTLVRWRCYLAFWRTFAACLLLRRAEGEAREWRGTFAAAAATLGVATLGLSYTPASTFIGRGSLGLFVLLLPQALAVSLPVSVLGSGLIRRGPVPRARAGRVGFFRSVLAYSIVAAVLSLCLSTWLVPQANHEFRQRVYHTIVVRAPSGPVRELLVPKGYPEMSLSEIKQARDRMRFYFVRPYDWRMEWERATYQIHLKGGLPAAAVALGLAAVALAPRKRRRFAPAIGLALAAATLFAYYLAVHWSRELVWAMVVPGWLGAWAPPLLFSELALAVLWKRAVREAHPASRA